MSKSTTSFLFPDINVWVALASRRHAHHALASRWYAALPETTLVFCRYTQLGFLRLLTTEAVMGIDVLTQQRAWKAYDDFFENGNSVFFEEPPRLEITFRSLARQSMSSPKEWADSYLAAFSETAKITLVTFDRGLKSRVRGAILIS